MSALHLHLINDLIKEKDIHPSFCEAAYKPVSIEMPVGCDSIAIGRSKSNMNLNYKISTLVGRHITSRIHSAITRYACEDIFHIWDFSINGTFVNYKRVDGATVLSDGDIVTFGHPQGASIIEGSDVLPYRPLKETDLEDVVKIPMVANQST